MNKVLRTILILVLVLALLGTGFWYFFIYHSGLPASMYASYAEMLERGGRYDRAARFYAKALDLEPENTDLALKAAGAYSAAGNETKAEYTLVRAISVNPDALELYCKLSAVYVEQDKLLDAERLISACASESVKAQLMALRPAAPVIQPDGGYSLEPTAFSLAYGGGTACYSLSEEYPSLNSGVYTEPVTLDFGLTTVSAIVVSEDGLVSPLVTADFTVCGEIEEVTFQDEAFDAMIRDLLGVDSHKKIMTTDLWAMTELTVPAEVTNLADLSYFVSLKSLTVQNSAAQDFSALSALQVLDKLDLSGTQLSGDALAAVGALPSLTEVDLSSCGLGDISALSTLKNIRTLDLSDNSLSDISALGGMPELETLDLSGNSVSSLSPLMTASKLAVLDISGNPVSTLGALSANTALTTLTASGCAISDLSPLENKTALETLDLSSNEITDVTPLRGCTALKDLKLVSNQIEDLDPAAALTGLENLDASSNRLARSPQFPDGSSLLTLNLSFNELTELDGLTKLHKLNYICLNDNRLTDLSAIADLASLVQVDAYRNPLESVECLTARSILVSYDEGYTLPEEEPTGEEAAPQEGETPAEPASSGNDGVLDSLDGRVTSAEGG